MKSFRQYIVEFVQKNTHIQHLEDFVFSGEASAQVALSFLNSLKNVLVGISTADLSLGIKWDGSPSIICGPDPVTGRFFIGTKGVFNKVPKVCYGHDDIELQFAEQEELVVKLKHCFDYLSEIKFREIWQGDVLFTQDSVSIQKIGEHTYVTFTPNTITYAVPEDTQVADRIQRAKLGVAFHTTYSGDSFANLKASFGSSIEPYQNNMEVWMVDSRYSVEGSTELITPSELKYITGRLSDISNSILTLDGTLFEYLSKKRQFLESIKMYVNSRVRAGLHVTAKDAHLPEFRDFVVSKAGDAVGDIVDENRQSISSLFHAFSLISELKLFFLNKMNTIGYISTFIKTEGGFRSTSPEGFVAVDRLGNVSKLVNRLEFSRENFLKNG